MSSNYSSRESHSAHCFVGQNGFTTLGTSQTQLYRGNSHRTSAYRGSNVKRINVNTNREYSTNSLTSVSHNIADSLNKMNEHWLDAEQIYETPIAQLLPEKEFQNNTTENVLTPPLKSVLSLTTKHLNKLSSSITSKKLINVPFSQSENSNENYTTQLLKSCVPIRPQSVVRRTEILHLMPYNSGIIGLNEFGNNPVDKLAALQNSSPDIASTNEPYMEFSLTEYPDKNNDCQQLAAITKSLMNAQRHACIILQKILQSNEKKANVKSNVLKEDLREFADVIQKFLTSFTDFSNILTSFAER